jgi:hypothetical protein
MDLPKAVAPDLCRAMRRHNKFCVRLTVVNLSETAT